MIEGIQLKVCGITSAGDARLAGDCGADCLGFILHPQSPRHVSLEQFRAMAPQLPNLCRVAVSVEPSGGELEAMRDSGFDFFQVHFRMEVPEERMAGWSRVVGREKLWLAPRVPPGSDFPPAVPRLARHVLVDTFSTEGFGGSGRPGDWSAFARLRAAFADNVWILAGGLNPENVARAVRKSGARFVDVNSGVERAPGAKDEGRLKAFVLALREAAGKP